MPWFRGCQEAPPSSDRKTPAAEIPIQSFCASSGSSVIECVISPPAPGDHFSRVSWPSTASFTCQLAPESSERKSTPGSPPSQSVPGSDGCPGSRCHVEASLSPLSSGRPRPSERSHVLPMSVERWTVPP